MKLVLRLLQQCYAADPARFLETCSMILQPESNCCVDVRTQCLTGAVWPQTALQAWPNPGQVNCVLLHVAMEYAVEAQASGCEQQPQTHLWTAKTLDSLFFCLLQDSSVRVRRAAMRVLSAVAVPEGAASAAQLFHVLKLKLQDRSDTPVCQRGREASCLIPSREYPLKWLCPVGHSCPPSNT
jgi:hypothetical protein